MICGIGIDLIEVQRIKKLLSKHNSRFPLMVFTEKEILYCQRTKNLNVQSQCFAARFSAKEAFFKAIGTGLRDGLRWKDVEVSNDALGKPYLCLRNRALETVQEVNVTQIQLSISHSKNYATAVVILEKNNEIE